MVSAGFPPDIGGVETHLGDVSRELLRRGIDVTVLCPVRGLPAPGGGTALDGTQLPGVVRVPSKWSLYRGVAAAARSSDARDGVDIVHHHYSRPLAPFVVGAVRKVPLVITLHGGIAGSPDDSSILLRGAKTFVDRALVPSLLRRSSAVIAVSPPEEQRLARLLRGEVSRVHRIPYPMPSDAVLRSDLVPRSSDRFLVLARLSKEKRIRDLILAISADPGLPGCDIAGPDGNDAGELRELARRICPDRIRFLGPVVGPGRLELLRSAIALVLPSQREGMPICAIEAFSQETPVIASDDASQGLPPESTVRYATGDVGALGRSLRELTDPHRWRAQSDVSRRARREISDLESYVDRLLETYVSAIHLHR